MHIWVDKRIRPCCQSLNKLQHKNTLTRAHMCSGWVGTSARTIRRVSGESSKAELNTDFDEWSVKTMSPSWPAPPLPRRVCECARWKGGGDRGYRCMCSCRCVGESSCVCNCGVCIILVTLDRLCEWHAWDATQVSGLGSDGEWNGRERRVKHPDPQTTLTGIKQF